MSLGEKREYEGGREKGSGCGSLVVEGTGSNPSQDFLYIIIEMDRKNE